MIPGIPFHITQRGNNRQDVFFVDDDWRHYLAVLAAQAERFGLDLHGYCLMRNHVHLVATPRAEDSLAKAVGRTNFLYAIYVNRLHHRSGHLWQNRFFSCALDDAHYLTALRYVERNAVRARLVRQAWHYPWSSAAAHVGAAPESLPLADGPQLLPDWRNTLLGDDDATQLSRLRHGTINGRPLGTDAFVAKMEKVLGRRVSALSVGRPRKRRTDK